MANLSKTLMTTASLALFATPLAALAAPTPVKLPAAANGQHHDNDDHGRKGRGGDDHHGNGHGHGDDHGHECPPTSPE